MLNQQGVQKQPLEVKDFSGGMTDNYVGANSNKFELADNFTIQEVNGLGRLITRPGLAVVDSSNARVPTNTRINDNFDLAGTVFQVSNKKIYYNSSGYQHLTGPSGNNAFDQGGETSFYSLAKWNNHAICANSDQSKIVKVFKSGSDFKVHTLGLPSLTLPTITGTGSGKSFLYAFHYSYQYTSNGNTFEEVGPVVYSSTATTNTDDPGTTAIAISSIPVLANGSSDNYDTDNIKVNIYRTTDGGSVYYYSGQVTNGTTTYNDNVADTAIDDNVVLYTDGDVPEHEEPPPAKFLHVVNDVLVLGAVKESGTSYPNKARFSNRFQLWSCPSEYYEEFDEDITGISSVNIYPIVFCKNKVYRIEGYYNPDGTGAIFKREISSKAGCISERSIVQTEKGLFWAGNDGFYWTDGSQVIRISEGLNITFKELTSTDAIKARIYGVYDSKNQLVLWTMQENTANSDNDTIFVCHEKFGIKPDMAFTSWSGGEYLPTNFAPTCLYFFNDVLYHCDTNGYLFYYDNDTLHDKKVDTAVAASSWTNVAIIYKYRSPAFDFGTTSVRKWVPKIAVTADNASTISMQISSNRDNSGELNECAEFSFSGSVAWGEYSVAWGDANLRWNYFPIISGQRWLPKPNRCMYLQVVFTNSYTEIVTSTLLGTATFDNSANTATLDNVSNSWPSDVTDYYISSARDSYVSEFKITARTSNTVLTLQDTSNLVPDGAYAWKINGYRRDEILKLISYTIYYDYTSPTQDAYRAS